MRRRITEQEICSLRELFTKAAPFPHVSISNFLSDPNTAYRSIQKEKFYLKDSDLFTFLQTNNLQYAKSEGMKKIVKYLLSDNFCKLVSSITKVQMEGKAVDLFGSLYLKNHHLLCHDDLVEDRKIAFILYLCENFSVQDGGSLALYTSKKGHPDKLAKKYSPIFNSLLLFKVSKSSWHEVQEVVSDKSRYAISGWLH
jgi:prolyl 3-hydroxylase /prolyl 3,4-dihydroxylase